MDLEIWGEGKIYGVAGGTKELNSPLKVSTVLGFMRACYAMESQEEARVIFLSKRKARIVLSDNFLSSYIQSIRIRKIKKSKT